MPQLAGDNIAEIEHLTRGFHLKYPGAWKKIKNNNEVILEPQNTPD